MEKVTFTGIMKSFNEPKTVVTFGRVDAIPKENFVYLCEFRNSTFSFFHLYFSVFFSHWNNVFSFAYFTFFLHDLFRSWAGFVTRFHYITRFIFRFYWMEEFLWGKKNVHLFAPRVSFSLSRSFSFPS